MARVTNTRKEFKPMEEAAAVLSKLSDDDLKDMNACKAQLKGKIKLTTTAIGRVRTQLLRARNGEANGTADNGDLLQRIRMVKRLSKALGGLAKLEATIAVVREVQGL